MPLSKMIAVIYISICGASSVPFRISPQPINRLCPLTRRLNATLSGISTQTGLVN